MLKMTVKSLAPCTAGMSAVYLHLLKQPLSQLLTRDMKTNSSQQAPNRATCKERRKERSVQREGKRVRRFPSPCCWLPSSLAKKNKKKSGGKAEKKNLKGGGVKVSRQKIGMPRFIRRFSSSGSTSRARKSGGVHTHTDLRSLSFSLALRCLSLSVLLFLSLLSFCPFFSRALSLSTASGENSRHT